MLKTQRCSDCGEVVKLCRKENRTLVVTCDCDKTRSVRVAKALPTEWDYDE